MRLLVKEFIKNGTDGQIDFFRHPVDLHLRAVHRKLHVLVWASADHESKEFGI